MVASAPKDPERIGILTFEMAATMARLVSIHRMVSDAEILNLRSETMRSRGVAHLSSTDQCYLLRLTCAELVEELDRTAEVVSRLCRRCRGPLPVGFDRVYTDFRTGSIDPHRILGLKFGGKATDKRVRKLETYVAAAAKLYKEMELLAELEAAERKKWGRFSGQKPSSNDCSSLHLDLQSQNQRVRKLKEVSLWNQPFDEAVELMALACYSIFSRICFVFSPFVTGLPRVVVNKDNSRMLSATLHFKFRRSTGPLERRISNVVIGNSCPIILRTKDSDLNVNGVNWSKVLEPPPNTIGGSGLALRYANIIVLAEKVMTTGDVKADREELHEMLPVRLRSAVRVKLRETLRERGSLDGSSVDGWKDAACSILGWLGPVAHDTVRWQAERNMDRRQRFEPCPRTYMLQTLHFSDKAKTEAAMVEVLVGLSLISWYEEQCRGGSYRY